MAGRSTAADYTQLAPPRDVVSLGYGHVSLPPDAPSPAERGRECNLCQQDVDPGAIVRADQLDAEVVLVVLANNPWWRPETGICAECAERFVAAHREAKAHYPAFARGGTPILPTPVRLFADERYSGRGVTIAFLDSGFYAHPDLTRPRDRILRYVDVNDPRAGKADLEKPDESSWHGMMTSVVACGNGWLSGRVYRGVASQARLVLVKVGTARRVVHDDIRRGLEWVMANRKRYGIRIVNVSCGGDYEASYLDDRLSPGRGRGHARGTARVRGRGQPRVPSAASRDSSGVRAVGAHGGRRSTTRTDWSSPATTCTTRATVPRWTACRSPRSSPPASGWPPPSCPAPPRPRRRSSSRGSGQRATPISLPLLAQSPGIDPALDAARDLVPPLLRQLVVAKLKDNNVISGAYKHVDGTSFAAPIVASVAAQMLQAHPQLTPQQAKLILIRTARRLPHVDPDRQGWGVVDARRAVQAAVEARAAARTRAPSPAAPR